MKYITSKENKIYKGTKKLLHHAHRRGAGLFIAEGERIVQDAISCGAAEYLVISEGYTAQLPSLLTYCFSEKLFSDISDTKSPQGIIAVCGYEKKDISGAAGDLLLICDGISDPGNLGAMIRTAECAGAGGVILLKGCADAYNPKTVRATMGSIFRVPVYHAITQDLAGLNQYFIAAATLCGSKDLYQTSFEGKTAVIIGSEAHGISDEAMNFASAGVKIPMDGRAQSLNAAVAAGVILYEVRRQIKRGDVL